MIFYHGTTHQIAERILRKGFSPEPPSYAVWFTTNKEYAIGHARGKAGERRDRPMVLECELDPQELSPELSRKCILGDRGLIACRNPLPPDVVVSYELIDLPASPHDLKSRMRLAELPSSPENLSAWLNQIFGLRDYSKISSNHPGVKELSRWMAKRRESGVSRTTIEKVLEKARQYLPHALKDAEVKLTSRVFSPKRPR